MFIIDCSFGCFYVSLFRGRIDVLLLVFESRWFRCSTAAFAEGVLMVFWYGGNVVVVSSAFFWSFLWFVAETGSTSSARPTLAAVTIARAARSALIESPGSAFMTLNQPRSAGALNVAFTWLPVRIMPGHTVVTQTSSAASSARSASESPTSANLLAQ